MWPTQAYNLPSMNSNSSSSYQRDYQITTPIYSNLATTYQIDNGNNSNNPNTTCNNTYTGNTSNSGRFAAYYTNPYYYQNNGNYNNSVVSNANSSNNVANNYTTSNYYYPNNMRYAPQQPNYHQQQQPQQPDQDDIYSSYYLDSNTNSNQGQTSSNSTSKGWSGRSNSGRSGDLYLGRKKNHKENMDVDRKELYERYKARKQAESEFKLIKSNIDYIENLIASNPSLQSYYSLWLFQAKQALKECIDIIESPDSVSFSSVYGYSKDEDLITLYRHPLFSLELAKLSKQKDKSSASNGSISSNNIYTKSIYSNFNYSNENSFNSKANNSNHSSVNSRSYKSYKNQKKPIAAVNSLGLKNSLGKKNNINNYAIYGNVVASSISSKSSKLDSNVVF